MPTYHGSCHCGAIAYHVTAPEISAGLRCNCSICIRKGALMTEFTVAPDQIQFQIAEGALSTYQFATQVAKHHFFNRCGIYTHHESRVKPGHIRLNIGCIEGLDATALPATLYDGAATAS